MLDFIRGLMKVFKQYVDDKFISINNDIDSIKNPSDMDALALVAEVGFVEPAMNNGYVLTDAKGTIYTF